MTQFEEMTFEQGVALLEVVRFQVRAEVMRAKWTWGLEGRSRGQGGGAQLVHEGRVAGLMWG